MVVPPDRIMGSECQIVRGRSAVLRRQTSPESCSLEVGDAALLLNFTADGEAHPCHAASAVTSRRESSAACRCERRWMGSTRISEKALSGSLPARGAHASPAPPRRCAAGTGAACAPVPSARDTARARRGGDRSPRPSTLRRRSCAAVSSPAVPDAGAGNGWRTIHALRSFDRSRQRNKRPSPTTDSTSQSAHAVGRPPSPMPPDPNTLTLV